MSSIVEKYTYSYKLNEVQLDDRTKIEEKCFIKTKLEQIALAESGAPYFYAYVKLYVPSPLIRDMFPSQDFPVSADSKKSLNVSVGNVVEDLLEGSMCFGREYVVESDTLEEAKSAINIIKQQLTDRINELNKEGVIIEQLLAGPVSTKMLNETAYAYATLRKTEDGKAYVERKYFLPAHPSPRGVAEFSVPALGYFKEKNIDDKSKSWIRLFVIPHEEYIIYTVTDSAEKIGDSENLSEKYEKILSSDLYGATQYFENNLGDQYKDFRTKEERVFEAGTNKVKVYVERNIDYDVDAETYRAKVNVYSPYLFSKNDIEDIQKLIVSSVPPDSKVSSNVVPTVIEGSPVNEIKISFELPQTLDSKNTAEVLTNTLVDVCKDFIEQHFNKLQSQLEEER